MKEITDVERESTQLWDERDLKWKLAYEARFKRLETVKFVKAVLFHLPNETYTSADFECAPFKNFLLLVDLDVTAAPTDIRIDVQFSHDRANWFKLMDGPFGSLMYEDSAGDKKECVHGKVLANWIRLYVVSSGCNTGKTFKLTVDGTFSG